MSFKTILYEGSGPIGWITLNRPDEANMFNVPMCHEICDCINAVWREIRTRVLVITGAGDRFFLHWRPEGWYGGHQPLGRRAADVSDVFWINEHLNGTGLAYRIRDGSAATKKFGMLEIHK